MTRITLLLPGEVVRIRKVLFSPFQAGLVGEKLIIYVPHRTIEKLTDTYKLFRDAVYGGGIVTVCRTFCFTD